MSIIAERKSRTQGIVIASGASQLEMEVIGQHSPNLVCRVSLVLTEQEATELRDELDRHIAKLRASKWVARIPQFDVDLEECE